MNFDDRAEKWDSELRIKRAEHISNEIIKAIDLTKECTAMEFGCGTGLVSFNLVSKFKNITLIDTSYGMIEKLNSKIKQQNIKNMTALRIDINDNSDGLDKYDVIYTSMAMHHIADTGKTIEKLYDLLNENGCLCIIDLNQEDGSFHSDDKSFNGHNGFNQCELSKQLEKAGFKGIHSETIYNGIKKIEQREIEYSLFLMYGIRQ